MRRLYSPTIYIQGPVPSSCRVMMFNLAIALFVAPLTFAMAEELAPGVRGLATRATGKVTIDGDLAEFAGAFCTPVNYFHPDLANRAAQFYYLWDDDNFYCGLRTLDDPAKQANFAPDDKLWEGDGVEWYFDTRRGDDFRDRTWGPGAVHMYWTAYNKTSLSPRWCLRPDMLKAIAGDGVEVAGRVTDYGAETEFKLPWKNFPDFVAKQGAAKLGAVLALDAELCYSDGAGRVDRTFAYGSPLSVQQPASQGMIELVEKLEPGYWKACGPVMLPVRCDTPWNQPGKALVTGMMAVPPGQRESIGKIEFRLLDLAGKTIADYPAQIKPFGKGGGFFRAEAQWPSDVAVPGAHLLVGIVYDKDGKELTRVAPRMVSAGWVQGY